MGADTQIHKWAFTAFEIGYYVQMSRNIHYLVDNLSLIAHKIAKEANITFPMTLRLLY